MSFVEIYEWKFVFFFFFLLRLVEFCVTGVLLRNCIGYSKMNHCNLKQNAFSVVGSEEMRGSVSISDLKGPVVCPKPRRVGVLANNSLRPLRWHMRYNNFWSVLWIFMVMFSIIEFWGFTGFCFYSQSSTRALWFQGWGRASWYHSYEGELYFFSCLLWFQV